MHKKRFIDQIINTVGTKFDVYIKNITCKNPIIKFSKFVVILIFLARIFLIRVAAKLCPKLK